jgi:2-aminoadipate transaminase
VEQGVFDAHLVVLKAEHRRRRDAMVHAVRQHVPAGALRFTVPDGGMYLWCQMGTHVQARAVHEHALKDKVVVVTGEPFYVDQGGAHQLRVCYTSQAPERAAHAAQVLARSLAAAARGTAESPRVRMV